MTDDDWQAAAEAVADDIMGTCQDLHTVLANHDLEGADNVHAFCYRLDAIVARCDVCSWWTEPCEIDDEGKCDQCADEARP